MSSVQHRLSDYLQCELYHSLGAYRVANERLAELVERLADAERQRDVLRPDDSNALLQLAKLVSDYNRDLASARHAADEEIRHPVPKALPLTLRGRFSVGDEPGGYELKRIRDDPWRSPGELAWVFDYYSSAIQALNDFVPDTNPGDLEGTERETHMFAVCLTCPRDGTFRPEDLGIAKAARLLRYKARRTEAARCLTGETGVNAVAAIVRANLGTDADSLPMFVVRAQAEAHLSMHGVEAWKSLNLGGRADLADVQVDWLKRELDRCITLQTFVYSASRGAPWIFAEDEREASTVLNDPEFAWQNVVPTRCMWISAQLSLLALHRRAYARALKGDRRSAYNDYYKLQRQIRDTRRRLDGAPIHVDEAHGFLEALDAQAHHHIGELYRADHAHVCALGHFKKAEHRLESLRRETRMTPVLVDSRWYVHLLASRGKAAYEMGHHKQSLGWHLRAWCAFLELLAADTGTEANLSAIKEATEWLDRVRYEPEVRKSDIVRYMRPVVAQLDGITVERRLTALAAEILLRLGHLLFVLNLGADDPEGLEAYLGRPKGKPFPRKATDVQMNGLAFFCLQKAAECDPHSTLIGSDLLKIRFRFLKRIARKVSGEARQVMTPREMARVEAQWPLGGDNYERLSRATEYLLLSTLMEREEVELAREEVGPARRKAPPAPSGEPHTSAGEEDDDREIAEHLILSFLTHTDSINVRKAQAHLYLTQERVADVPPSLDSGPAIELVCMRRYSSAFPLLPRPSAFRALGGGYLVRLHQIQSSDGETRPFGIALDPGADFVENLYRSGYSLSDVDMVIVTHDHVDHLGSLDPLLSLLYARSEILEHQGSEPGEHGDAPPIQVLCNRSVRRRYAKVKRLRERNKFVALERFATLDEGQPPEVALPDGWSIVSMSSRAVDGVGHMDLGANPSYGVCICREGGGPSLAITSDVPKPKSGCNWEDVWRPALDADVLVAHLSSVPLTELRQLAKLKPEAVIVERAAQLAANVVAPAAESAAKLWEGRTEGAGGLEEVAKLEQIARDLAATVGWLNGERRHLERAADVEHARFTGKLEALADDLKRLAQMAQAAEVEDATRLGDFYTRGREAIEDLVRARARLKVDAERLAEIRSQFEGADGTLSGRVEWGLWLRSGYDRKRADLVGAVPDGWLPPQGHPYLAGLLAWARAYRRPTEASHAPGLFVVGELSEELGSFRRQVATALNDHVFDDAEKDSRRAFTADIGLRIVVSSEEGETAVKVQCTNCSLDTDRVPEERFHDPAKVFEVCAKGENEGIFYNCFDHDPAHQEDPTFLEQLERYDVFGR
ncbi:MAG TPA: MBL fold metallo-hydrolase [Solirubrobacteraceae bacterium]|nr:MBL fold metallo-hydrolase [Solirubrobacteraceae bacterium]